MCYIVLLKFERCDIKKKKESLMNMQNYMEFQYIVYLKIRLFLNLLKYNTDFVSIGELHEKRSNQQFNIF